ncbi:phage tail fiber protein [Pseudomonas solani]|uniref:phage tail fiber protein n=1 Tax=Pseudomonas solani TaxID=2731552 RepID=UPI003D6B48C9
MSTPTYTSEQIIDLLFTNSTKYVSEHTGDPGAVGANEVAGGADANYARKASTLVKNLSGTIYSARNSADVVFNAAAAGASYSVTHLGIWDAASGGNFLASLALPVSIPVVVGTINTFALNDIVIRGD